jgi:hypothetical protein
VVEHFSEHMPEYCAFVGELKIPKRCWRGSTERGHAAFTTERNLCLYLGGCSISELVLPRMPFEARGNGRQMLIAKQLALSSGESKTLPSD